MTALDVAMDLARRGVTAGVIARTADEPPHVAAILQRRIDVEPATDITASEAVTHRIVRAVRGQPQAPGAPLHASGSCAASPVALRGGSTTVIAALDDVARQVPGLAWPLTFASDDADRFMLGLLCRGGGSASGLLEPLLP